MTEEQLLFIEGFFCARYCAKNRVRVGSLNPFTAIRKIRKLRLGGVKWISQAREQISCKDEM